MMRDLLLPQTRELPPGGSPRVDRYGFRDGGSLRITGCSREEQHGQVQCHGGPVPQAEQQMVKTGQFLDVALSWSTSLELGYLWINQSTQKGTVLISMDCIDCFILLGRPRLSFHRFHPMLRMVDTVVSTTPLMMCLNTLGHTNMEVENGLGRSWKTTVERSCFHFHARESHCISDGLKTLF